MRLRFKHVMHLACAEAGVRRDRSEPLTQAGTMFAAL
jgi:hypothetical protein